MIETMVRPARASDAAAIIDIHVAAYEDTFYVEGEALEEIRAERALRWRRVLGGETWPSTVLVAVREGAVVGFAASHPDGKDWSWEYLASLYTAPGARSTGCGALLLRELADRLGAVGRRRLWAHVLSHSMRARSFYARMGAREVGEQQGDLAGRPVFDVILQWPSLPDLATAARRVIDARLAPPLALGWRETPSLKGAPHPAGEAGAAAERYKNRLSAPFGISQFGVNRLVLAPGVHSAPGHVHSHEDEFVTLLEGEVWLVSGGVEQRLAPGDCAGFAAGNGRAHRLENRSDRPAVVLEVGSRLPDRDTVAYEGRDLRVIQQEDGARVFVRGDGTVLGSAD
ncbi:MAG: GNAT family N-acetyltransferase [Pseudomonadota bacterium]